MAGARTRTPRLRDILFGVAASIVLIFALINLGVVVKFIGAGFLVIPSALGIVQVAGARDVVAYNLSSSPTQIAIGQPGRYALYAYDYDLLTISDQLEQADAAPWITLKSQITGQTVPVAFVTRGMRPYDTYLAKGRPVLSFVITQPGIYLMDHTSRDSTISIVRDYVTGKEPTLVLVILVQIALVTLPLTFVFGRRYLGRRNARRAAQRRKREESDAFWRTRPQEPPTWRRPE